MLAHVRRRDGAYQWGIYRDIEAANRFVEIFLVHSWAEHLRQHERQTNADRELEEQVYSYVAGEPKVRHLLYADSIARGGRHECSELFACSSLRKTTQSVAN